MTKRRKKNEEKKEFKNRKTCSLQIHVILSSRDPFKVTWGTPLWIPYRKYLNRMCKSVLINPNTNKLVDELLTPSN